MTSMDPRALRNAFGTFTTGVTVATAFDEHGVSLGFTANSFTSVSITPPLVLVCLANSSQNLDVLVNAKGFAVNILSETQIEVSNTFARPKEACTQSGPVNTMEWISRQHPTRFGI